MIDTSQPLSPGWWLKYLSDAMNARAARLTTLKSYLEGDAPLPEGASGLREAYQSFQRKARWNCAELIVEAVQERMSPSGFRIGDEAALSKDANRIWSYNELDTHASDVHADMLGLSAGYVMVGPSQDGIPAITREDPTLTITSADPLRPSQARAAMKLFRDDVTGKDSAYLFLPGVVYVAEADNGHSSSPISTDVGRFTWVSTEYWPRGFEDVVPVIHFRNKNDVAEFERHTDTIDRINYVILQRLVIIAMQAYRQRAIKGELPEVELDADGNPATDDNGDPIPVDLAAMFKPGPGALWTLPEGAELWESQTTDITPILTAAKDDIRDVAASTRTPMYTLMPDAANQSAEGARTAREQLVYKTEDRIKRATYGWNQVMSLALRFAGVSASLIDMETLWLPAERFSLAERADAAQKLIAAQVPWETVMADVMQFSPEKVEEMQAQRMADAVAASIALAGNGGQ